MFDRAFAPESPKSGRPKATQTLAVNVALVRSYLEQVRTRIHEANEDDLNILFKHLFQLKIDLKTGEGQLFVKLAPQESVTDFVYQYGRSASTRRYASGSRVWLATVAA